MECLPYKVNQQRGYHDYSEWKNPVFTNDRTMFVAITFQQLLTAGDNPHIAHFQCILSVCCSSIQPQYIILRIVSGWALSILISWRG